MDAYLGFGFNVDEIKADGWGAFLSEHDPELHQEIAERIDAEEDTDEYWEAYGYALADKRESCELAELLAYVINAGERPKLAALTKEESFDGENDDVVQVMDEYVYFKYLCFANDSPRAKLIPSARDFIHMIGRYIATDDIHAAEVWFDNEYNRIYLGDS